MKLAKFLDKYDTVIFDMDGVITSEENYWNCAALTICEYLKWNRNEKIDSPQIMADMKNIRRKVFCDDEIIGILKGKGVNSNWDLGYVVVLISWICNGRYGDENFEKVLEYAKNLSDNIIDEYDNLARICSEKTGFDYSWLKRNDLMWRTMRDIFQMWFLGDELFEKTFGYPPLNGGKAGLLYKEEPIVDKKYVVEMMRLLSEKKRVCTGTGRPYIEMIPPITNWGIKQYFATDGLCNYDHVVEAEKKLNNNTLTKPHPYMFLKALYGIDYDDEKLVNGDYDKEKIKTTLVVGDAGADIIAAQAMGADFCAVLTGINGKKARGYFENLGSTYILNSVADFLEED